MNILQQPDALSLSYNLKDFILSASDPVSFLFKKGDQELLSQVYSPGSDGKIIVKVRDIIHSQLSFRIQDISTIYEQPDIVSDFTAVFNDYEITFRAIRCGVEMLSDSPSNFLTQNFLTWQPQLKQVTYSSPEFLTYYAVVNSSVKVKAFFADESGLVTSEEIKIIASLDAGKAYTIPVQYAVISALFESRLPAFYDVYIENSDEERLTYIQRYAAGPLSENEDWILFENSLGGLDTMRAYGDTSFAAEHTHNIAEIDEVSEEYRIDTERKYKKNTGYLDLYERKWLLDFFPSQRKLIYTNGALRSIVVVESDAQYQAKELPSNYNFTYKYADAKPLLHLTRTATPAEVLNIKIPDLGNFTVPPRLVEIGTLPLSEGALFPIQNPYSEEWKTTTAGALLSYIASRLTNDYQGGGGVGHSHANIDLLNVLSLVQDYLLADGRKVKSGYADKAHDLDADSPVNNRFLRKDQADRTEHDLCVGGELTVGEFVDSLVNGKGAGILPDGRAQLSRLEVRDSLTVMEMIFNRLSAMESDYSFSESGTIEAVEDLGENTYRLTLRKRWDNDFTAL
ncbi:MAG: hypothetical protein WCR36_03400, partial [Bacteroidaceae bacterium]